jgi:hypothetical protein
MLDVNRLTAQRFETRQGAGFIVAHQPAVSRDVGREDGREPAFDRSPLKVPSLGRPAWSVGRPRQVCPSDVGQSTMDQLVLTHRAR